MALNLDEVRKLHNYLGVILAAEAVLAEPEPQAPEPVDVEAWKVSQANRILAGSGDKAALMGTLSTAPVVVEKTLTDLDVYPSLAADLVKRRDEIRATALAQGTADAIHALAQEIDPKTIKPDTRTFADFPETPRMPEAPVVR